MDGEDYWSGFEEAENHSRTIIHLDLDCFYAQVEMVRNPALRTKPLGVYMDCYSLVSEGDFSC